MQLHMLTTVDNPFNPFTHFDEWRVWDESHGYHTLALQARVLVTSDELSESDQDVALENAIDEVVRENVSGMHKKVAMPEAA
jgi:uncharacterized Fe-S cluster-containing protein